MTDEERNKIALTIARRVVWTSKPPEDPKKLHTWLEDGAREYGLTIEQFTAFADFALDSAFTGTRVHLSKLIKPANRKIGFSPIQT